MRPSTSDAFPPGGGGGICNDGTLTMTDCTVNDNATGRGGTTSFEPPRAAAAAASSTPGALTMTGCTVSGNSTGRGGDGHSATAATAAGRRHLQRA